MSEAKRTEYVVLKHGVDVTSWSKVDVVQATSAKAAIQAAFKGDGTYVAVPVRSWKPEKVEEKSRAFLAFGEDKPAAVAEAAPEPEHRHPEGDEEAAA
jgi:hypothetical protein